MQVDTERQAEVEATTLVVQFRSSDDVDLEEELNWRREIVRWLNSVVMEHGVGSSDGGQHGDGTVEIFFLVTDAERAAQLLIEALTDRELIAWTKIASARGNDWYTHYPPGADFSIWSWPSKGKM